MRIDPASPATPQRDRSPGRRVGSVLPLGDEGAFACSQPRELGPDPVHAPLALRCHGDAARRRTPPPYAAHERRRVVPDVRLHGPDDVADLGELGRVVADALLQRPRSRTEAGARAGPRIEKALLAGDDVAAHAGLEVDHELLELICRAELFLRVTRELRRVAEIGDRDEHEHEGHGNDHRQRAAGHDHPEGEPGSHSYTSIDRG